MKFTKLFLCVSALVVVAVVVTAQNVEYSMKLPIGKDSLKWHVVNRLVLYSNEVKLSKAQGDGLLYFNDLEFGNGTIELDIKGKNDPGKSFVGIAFHILNDKTFDAVYFRPFNFEDKERKFHSAQYVSMPQYDWSRLRESYPGKYENTVQPVPNPDDWFHATIVVNFPEVKVYVDYAGEPSLVVRQISTQKKGKVGFWVGNYSEGSFKNLKINTITQ